MEVESRGRAGGDGGVGLGFPYWVAACRRFDPHDPFFASGNIERELLAKHAALDLTDNERNQLHNMDHTDDQVLFCPIVGCGSRLTSLEDFEDHYHARHTACCSICSRVYPTSRLLSIHVSEAHDSFFQAKVARGFPMYECLVEGCGMKLKSYQRRQQHLVDKHKFPTTFEFLKKTHPSKQQRQRYQRKQTSHQRAGTRNAEMDVEGMDSKQKYEKDQHEELDHKEEDMRKEMEVDQKVEDLVSAVANLSTSDSSPSSFSFGRRHSRGLAFLPRSVLRNKKYVDTTDANR